MNHKTLDTSKCTRELHIVLGYNHIQMQDANRVIDDFYRLYMSATPNQRSILHQTRWMNVPCFKLPQDLFVYQDIICEIKPDLIIETGTFLGGSTLFLAHMLDLVGRGKVVSIDIQKLPRPQHPRITYLHGSSTDGALVEDLIAQHPNQKIMVILDSDHHQAHVEKELELFAAHVSLNSYLIVEDTHLEKTPEFGAGPLDAIRAFLPRHPEFVVDTSKEKFLLSFNSGGYLKRIALEVI
jgi:cephalosporin hydroxylase